jgi:hypothetical protein
LILLQAFLLAVDDARRDGDAGRLCLSPNGSVGILSLVQEKKWRPPKLLSITTDRFA